MEAAGRTPKDPKGGGRRGRTSRGRPGGETGEPFDNEGAGGWEAPVTEARTPLEAGDRHWWDAHPGKPIPVQDGIAATTRRGPIGSTWWSQRFLGSLEAVMVGGRMERGRSYARKGQVVSLTVNAGVVAAVVQGSRQEPYRVRLSMPVTTDAEWERIIADLGARASYAARLLAGDLPHEVEEVFEQSGASLFPGPQARLVTECTCPDFENPCKHIAAVCYLVAEMFDRDPFRVLEWRGRDRNAVVGALRTLRAAPSEPSEATGSEGGDAGPARERASDARDRRAGPAPGHDGELEEAPPLATEGFWTAGPGLADVHVRPVAAALPDAVLRQLPRGLIRVRGRDVADVLAGAYESFTAAVARRTGG